MKSGKGGQRVGFEETVEDDSRAPSSYATA
jgi:hypothetical protein